MTDAPPMPDPTPAPLILRPGTFTVTTERTILCADGTPHNLAALSSERIEARDAWQFWCDAYNSESQLQCGPHRVASRQIIHTEWVDE